MKVRGRRECRSCGRQWSYYETGSVTCPDCGSLRSVGVGERARHTAGPASLDLSSHRDEFEERPRGEWADDLKSALREYRRRRGFIDAGELVPLDDTYLAASELLHVADVYGRRAAPTEDERHYLLTLLRGTDAGERPPTDAVPASLADARGLAYASAVDEYRGDVATWLDDNPDPEGRTALGTLRDHLKRTRALHGDVPLDAAETLVTTVRDVAEYLREDDETALARARNRLASL